MKVARSAAIYARISKDVTGEGLGVERQLQDCRALARELGWTVGDEYRDNDVSAYSGKVRPEYRRMLEDLKSGARDGVIVWHADRLHRSPVELEEYIDICDSRDIETLSVRSGVLDLATASGRTVARIHGAIARGESERMSERMRRGNRQRAEQGRPRTNGTRCYGYTRTGTDVIPEEAAVIRDLVERFLAGESLSALVRWLNDTGVPTVGGSRWYSAGVRGLLRNARLSGQREYRGDIVALGQWPAIITPEQTAAVRRILDDPARKRERAPSRYLLTRLLRCGLCGKPLISHPRGNRPAYDCRKDAIGGCGRISISAEPLDEYIRDAVLDALDSPQLATALASRDHPDLDTDALIETLRAAEARQLDIAAAFGAGELTREQVAIANQTVQQEITTSREKLAALTGQRDLARYIGQGDDLRARWHGITLDQRRAVIRAVIDTVTISPSSARGVHSFDPDRATIHWRV